MRLKSQILSPLLTLGLLPSGEAFDKCEIQSAEEYKPEPSETYTPEMVIQYQKYDDLSQYDEMFDTSAKRPYKRPSQKKRRINQRRANSKRF